MNPVEIPFALVRESFTLLLVVGGPIFATIVSVGLFVGALQAATQINDPALSFVPRMIALGTLLLAAGGWMLDTLVAFFVGAAGRF